MYEDLYGFVQPPFTLAPDPRFFYRSESHDGAIRLILQSLRRKEPFIVLTGDIGTGKTTLCRTLLQQLDTTTFTSLVLNPFLSVEELLREILLDFGVVSREAVRSGRIASATKHELASALRDFLLSLVPLHGSGILIIDEAQHLSPQVLEEIRVLSNLETNESKLLQVVLVGQLNLLDTLAGANMRQLDQRISLRARLTPLTREEVDAYISHRLSVAVPRGTSPVTFAGAAVDRIHAISEGVPRVINLLCDRALMLSADTAAPMVTAGMVDKAADILALARPVTPAERRGISLWIILVAALVLVIALIVLFAPIELLVDGMRPRSPGEPPLQAAALRAVELPSALQPL